MKNFVMSFRFNKQKPEDFGLKYEAGKFYSYIDRSEWILCELYDFGWGRENGYCKLPIPNFDELIDIIQTSNDEEDCFGAAAIIEQQYVDELKSFLIDSISKKEFTKQSINRLEKFLKLSNPINRTLKMNMSMDEVTTEHADWKKIASFFKLNY